MKLSSFAAVLLISFASVASTGCAFMTKGKKQEVVVRSTPVGAVTRINGTEVGQTPFKVKLGRNDVYRLDFQKPGFATESALLMPSSTDYDQRFLRWGVDYSLGGAVSLVPSELYVELKPAMSDVIMADRFEEMSAQIVRADALLTKGDLSPADHKYLVDQIVATYHRTN